MRNGIIFVEKYWLSLAMEKYQLTTPGTSELEMIDLEQDWNSHLFQDQGLYRRTTHSGIKHVNIRFGTPF